jgi:DegV family protein with EDD domain
VNKVKLFADSTCDLSPELIKRHDIYIIPMYVTLGDESRKDGVEVTVEEVFAYTDKTKQTPKTAAVSIIDFLDSFRPFIEAGQDIIYVGISAKFSSSVPNAMVAMLDFPEGRIEVVDSMNLSSGIGLMLLQAGWLVEQGLSAAQIADLLREATPKVHASFVLDTLLFLYRGGRCSAVQAFGANALSLKPSIVVADGAMRPDKKYRGSIVRCAEKYAADILSGADNADRRHVFITYSPSQQEIIDTVRSMVVASGMFDEVHLTKAGCVIASHCGPNTIGVLYMDK